MEIDVIVPVRRRAMIARLLQGFSRNTVRPTTISLVTNDLDAVDVGTCDLDVRLVRFESDSYPIGFHDVALRRNVGIWASTASHIVTFDDDQVAAPSLVHSMMRVLAATPVCWGHYRYIDMETRTFDELIALSPDAGRTRETPPNAWHTWRSAYGGLFGAERTLVQQAGGFDMVFSGRHGGEDQNLGRRLAALVHGSDSVYVHEPPFAWHPDRAVPWDEPRDTNICRGEHELIDGEVRGVPAQTCRRCPLYYVLDSVIAGHEVLLPFDPSQVRITVEPFPRGIGADALFR
jgi:hypothetical protein